MQWLIDIIKEWVEAQGFLQQSFFDRGDPAAFDFTLNDFIRDSTWRDLDLSNIVPAGAKAVSLYCELQDTAILKHVYFRTKGNVNVNNISKLFTNVANVKITGDLVVPLDSNRFIQYQSNIQAFRVLNAAVKGWWL